MSWVNVSKGIPSGDIKFLHIIEGLVFNCPSSIERKKKDGSYKNGNTRNKIDYKPVSARNVSFRSRGIEGDLFITLLATIRRPLLGNKTYANIPSNQSVETTMDNIIKSVELSDPLFEVMVYQTRDDMPALEAVYYYIRNAFAHGSFEVSKTSSGNIYILESAKDGKVKAQMRLKESTLEEYIRLASLTSAGIKALRKQKKKKA